MNNNYLFFTIATILLTCSCKPSAATKEKSIEALKAGQSQSVIRKQICDNDLYKVNDDDVKSHVVVNGFNQNPNALAAAKDGYASALKSIPAVLNNMFVGGELHIFEKFDGVGCLDKKGSPVLSMCYKLKSSDPAKTGSSAVPEIHLYANGEAVDDETIKELIHSLLTVELVTLYDEWFTPMAKSVKAPSNDANGEKTVKAINDGIAKYEGFRAELAKAFVKEVKAGADKVIGDNDADKATATDAKNTLAAMRTSLAKNFNKSEDEFEKLAGDPKFQAFVLAETVDSEACSKSTRDSYKKLLPQTDEFYNKADNNNPFLLFK